MGVGRRYRRPDRRGHDHPDWGKHLYGRHDDLGRRPATRAGGTTGSIVGNVTDNATLAFDRSDSATFGGVISGAGLVDQIGGGTTILTGVNTYTGGTTISAGVLEVANNSSVGTGGIALDGGAFRSGAAGLASPTHSPSIRPAARSTRRRTRLRSPARSPTATARPAH